MNIEKEMQSMNIDKKTENKITVVFLDSNDSMKPLYGGLFTLDEFHELRGEKRDPLVSDYVEFSTGYSRYMLSVSTERTKENDARYKFLTDHLVKFKEPVPDEPTHNRNLSVAFRPQTLDEIIGSEKIVKMIANTLPRKF